MRRHSDYDKKMSSAFLRQRDDLGEGAYLNDTLHPQHYYIHLDINDPDNPKSIDQLFNQNGNLIYNRPIGFNFDITPIGVWVSPGPYEFIIIPR